MNSVIVESLLDDLNASQRAAVSCTADQVAILAGPGSGKTHTLTSRTAWLLGQGLRPCNIIVATFTKKAALEMKERLGRLLGNGLEKKVIMGTFHGVASQYLHTYGYLIGLQKEWRIAERPDQLAILKRIVERHKFTIEPSTAINRISGRKARGEGDKHVKAKRQSAQATQAAQEFDLCYDEYEESLKEANQLDFDDLLLRCVHLLRDHPHLVQNVEAVLIDEFQDTNIIQFELMKLFAAKRRRVTIVGDPDQSIYGFRHAETGNFKTMTKLYPDTINIPLEENYRSAGSILVASMDVIRQDGARIDKSLLATHSHGTKPVIRTLSCAYSEATWIVSEIKRVRGVTGELIGYDDVAILLRSAALSRLIEGALGREGIPYRMVGGSRFYDRVEVKIVLDYLRVIDDPNINGALMRVVNVPKRGIGDTTINALIEEADQLKPPKPLWNLILAAVRGEANVKTKITKQALTGLSRFVNIVLSGRKKLADPEIAMSTTELIEYTLKITALEDYLEEKYPEDHETRWANIQELIAQAAEYTKIVAIGEDEEALPEIDGVKQMSNTNTLNKFLANVALSSEVKIDDGHKVAQVTISTIHSAKGLEWPVVFIPAAYEGSIPHSRAEDTDEERRLLYVAMTRAKALLYLSHPLKNVQKDDTTLSPFLTQKLLKHHMEKKAPLLKMSQVETIAKILARPAPSRAQILKCSEALESTEDDLWPLDGEESEQEKRRWDKYDTECPRHREDRPTKRQRIEGVSMPVQEAFVGFTSASIHLRNFPERVREPSPEKVAALEKPRASKKTKKQEGQNTLHSFFTKPAVCTTNSRIGTSSNERMAQRTLARCNTTSLSSQTYKPPSLQTATSLPLPEIVRQGLPADLASHQIRVGPVIGSLPSQRNIVQSRAVVHPLPKAADIVVLSSSPPPSPRLSQLGSSPFKESHIDVVRERPHPESAKAIVKTPMITVTTKAIVDSRRRVPKHVEPIIAKAPAYLTAPAIPKAVKTAVVNTVAERAASSMSGQIGFVQATEIHTNGRYYGHSAITQTNSACIPTSNVTTERRKKTLGVKRSMNGWANRARP